MKQVTQRLRNGQIEVLEVPRPVLLPEGVIVDVRASLVSAGTERSTVQAAREGLIGKARARPEQARAVLDRTRTEGVRSTVDAVRRRLDAPSGLGYSSAGVILEVGERVSDLRPGDRVACAGGGYAVHAEINYVPGNLCVRLPDGVSFASGAFATVGAIAMHGVHQAEVRLGERVAVIGLGLVGQLTCRLLLVAGCHVAGVEVSDELVRMAGSLGVDAVTRSELDPKSPPTAMRDFDAVIVTASTASEDPLLLAGALARDRGRVVVVGAVGMHLSRPTYYGKEIELRLSRSYGPGRYDREYEERGLDYPIGYVRWTERRNMAAFVELLASGRLDVEALITETVPVDDVAAAYDRLLGADASPLGIVITYQPAATEHRRTPPTSARRPIIGPGITPAAGVIGAGSFSQRLLIPGLRQAGFELKLVASANGLSAASAQERFQFADAVTPDKLIESDRLEAVAIASRHGSHARYAAMALARGHAVFVEKPPALSLDELERLRTAAASGVLQVGFNRRFAPLAQMMRTHVVTGGQPVELLYRVAAGRLSEDHWLNDPAEGGGRILGEGCHFIDFACWFMGALPDRAHISVPASGAQLVRSQRFAVTMTFPGGSLATILYGSESSANVGKELVEAHSGGRSATLYDYRRLELRGRGRTRTMRNRHGDKGHFAQFRAFRGALGGERLSGPDPLDTMGITLRALEAARTQPLADVS